MGQDVSLYMDGVSSISTAQLLPQPQVLLGQLHRLFQIKGKKDDGFDLEKEIATWLTDDDDTASRARTLQPYQYHRTRIGSPSVNRRSFTKDELDRFERENDGFPLPCTEEEIEAFDRQVFLEHSKSEDNCQGLQKKKRVRDRHRSKSATSVPDLATIRQKLQKLQAPGKPKFIEHLLSRVVSKRGSRPELNGLKSNNAEEEQEDEEEEARDVVEEQLSPDAQRSLEQAEALVEELVGATSKRPASGESTDSGKGSLLESTSDFSPTSKQTSWSTPTSPTFQGIVKQRLKGFQALQEGSDTESVTSQPASEPASPKQSPKPFQNEQFVQEISEINSSIKKFYSDLAEDETFSQKVMERGYVKALVQKINTDKGLKTDKRNENGELDENGSEAEEFLKLNPNDEDSGWEEWNKEHGDTLEEEEEEEEDKDEVDAVINGTNDCAISRNSDSTCSPSGTLRNSRSSSSRTSCTESISSVKSSHNSVSDSDSQVSKALRKFNQERSKSIPHSRFNSYASSSFTNHNSCFKSPPTLRHPKLGEAAKNVPATNHNANGAAASNASNCSKNRNCMSCDVESMSPAGQTTANERGCVSQSFDFGFTSPISAEELFEQHWSSKSEIRFDDFSDEELLKDEGEEDEMPKDKIHQIAYELLTTERAYVARLHLLDQVFQFRITMENKSGNFMPAEVVPQMFSNIKPIHSFHHDFLLPQLEARMKNWSKDQKIGDIMANLAPFLKLYTEYVKNYDNAMMLIDKWTSQSPKLASLLQEIQRLPECGQLTLQHHMLEPIQRVPRYEMLLKDYLKRLDQESPDRADTQKALNLVTEAAVHSNNAMKKLDRFNKLLTIIQRLNGDRKYDLISPTRELVKEGPITKISARSGEKQARYMFLFNDLLLVCSEQIMGSYKIRARLSVEGMTVDASDNINIANTFCLKCTEKTVEFLDESNNGNGSDWYAAVNQVLSDYRDKKKLGRVLSNPPEETVSPEDIVDLGTQLGKIAPKWVKDDEVTMCMACQDKFTRIKRRHHCRACGKVFCGRCSSKRIGLNYENNQISRVCTRCFDLLTTGHADEEGPKRIVDVQADKGGILSSYVNVSDVKARVWSKRWIAVHEDFVMYFYKKNKDVVALQTLPLPGHDVKALGTMQEKQNVFCLTHKDSIVCYFQVDSEDLGQQWVRVLEKMVRLELPEKEEKRLSTHSTGSSHSTCSDQSSQS